jgi:CRP/FNR family transcriptional regulator, cyclic AMP receptor protein
VGITAKQDFDTGDFLAKAGSGKRILEVRKNQNIFIQGEAAEAVFFIQKGSVKLTVVSGQGKEAVVGILQAGQFFGESCLDDQPLQPTTTTAMEDGLVIAITKGAMLAALHGHPEFSASFMAYLLTRNSRIAEDVVDLLLNSSEKRLARLLVRLADIGNKGMPQPITVPLNQEDLADMIGTTRSRVSFFMNKFRKLGLIDYNGKIEVRSSLLNAVLHDQPAVKRQPRPGEA